MLADVVKFVNGLPVALFGIVTVPDVLLEMDSGLDLSGLGVGPAFGSLERRVTELTFTTIEQVPDSLQQDVFIFDWWVKNGDRYLSENGGNPNLFWQPGNKELVVIDHNQAFDSSYKKEDQVNLHVFSQQVTELSGDFFRRDEYNEKFTTALNAWSQILDEVPESWWYADEQMTVPVDFKPDSVYELLNDYKLDSFWDWK